jgi:hypothetical protein
VSATLIVILALEGFAPSATAHDWLDIQDCWDAAKVINQDYGARRGVKAYCFPTTLAASPQTAVKGFGSWSLGD